MGITNQIDATELVRDIEEQLQRGFAGACQITLTNACPPEWGAVIVAGGVKFFYRDGSDYTDGPRPLLIASGQSVTFISGNPNECVFQFFIAANVQVGGKQQTITDQGGVGSGECLNHETVTIGPARAIKVEDLRADRISHFFRITKTA